MRSCADFEVQDALVLECSERVEAEIYKALQV